MYVEEEYYNHICCHVYLYCELPYDMHSYCIVHCSSSFAPFEIFRSELSSSIIKKKLMMLQSYRIGQSLYEPNNENVVPAFLYQVVNRTM